MESAVTPPGGGRRIAYGGQEIRVLYEAGDLAVAEFDVPAGFPGPVPHIHHDVDEGFHVLEGTLTMLVGEETTTAPAGSFAMVTRGTRHSFSNRGDEPVHLLGYWTPAHGLGLLDDIGALITSGGVPDPEAIAELYLKHNSELA